MAVEVVAPVSAHALQPLALQEPAQPYDRSPALFAPMLERCRKVDPAHQEERRVLARMRFLVRALLPEVFGFKIHACHSAIRLSWTNLPLQPEVGDRFLQATCW